jgi:hypothetical protein
VNGKENGNFDVVFKLSEALAGLDLGVIEEDDLEEAIPGIEAAGSPIFEIVANSPKALKITTRADQAWGEGFDLMHEEFEFKIGDKITVTGNFNTLGTFTDGWANPRVQILTNIPGDAAAAAHTTAGPFTLERVLTAADITSIVTTGENNPAAIRIGARAGGSVFTISEVKIERPSDAAPVVPTAADFTVTGLTQVAGSVVAVTITPRAGMSTGARTIWYEGIPASTYPKSQTVPQVAGSYNVTFDVAAAGGFAAAPGLVAGTLEVLAALVPKTTSLGAIVLGDAGDGGNHHFVLNAAMLNAIGDGQHYLLLETIGRANSGGFGGFAIQFEMYDDGNPHAWKPVGRLIDGWLGDVSWFPIQETDNHLWVVNMQALPNFNTLIGAGFVATGQKLILGINRDNLGDVAGRVVNFDYLMDKELLPMPDGAKAFADETHGYIMKVE